MLSIVKKALRLSVDSYDDEVKAYIEAGMRDLELCGITQISESDQLVQMAIVTYVRMHFGSPDNYEQLKRSYDEQKAQLQYSSKYGGDGDEQ